MKHLNDLIDKTLRQFAWLRRALLVIAAAGGILAAIMQAIISQSATPSGWLYGIQFLGVAIAIIIPALLALFDDSSADFVITANGFREERDARQQDLDTRQRELDALKAEFVYYVTLYETAAAMSELSDPLILAPREEREALRETLVLSVLDRLIERKQALFGMGDENWTFGVYRWIEDSGQLDMFATRRKSRVSEAQSHRSWKPGEGHVGQAFKGREELICADVTEPNVSGFVRATGENERGYDASTYVSFASIPIRLGDRDVPLGVLVATSNCKDRFVPAAIADEKGVRDTVEPLRAAANTLATILGVNHIKQHEGESDG